MLDDSETKRAPDKQTKLTPEQHDEKKWEAHRLSLRGQHAPAIAGQLEISTTTVKALLKEARREIRKHQDAAGHDDLAQFTGEMDADRAASLTDAEHPACSFRDRAAHRANATAASVNKAKALGVFVERRDVTSGGKSLSDILTDVLSRPVEIRVPDADNPFDGDD